MKEVHEYSGTNYIVIGINNNNGEILKRCDSYGAAKKHAEYHIAKTYDRVVIAGEIKIYEAVKKK